MNEFDNPTPSAAPHPHLPPPPVGVADPPPPPPPLDASQAPLSVRGGPVTESTPPPPPAPLANDRRPARRKTWWLVGAVTILVIGGGIAFFAQGIGESESAAWPSNPELQHAFESRIGDDLVYEQPLVAGSVDDLYIVEPGDATGTVYHYVDGELAWETEIDYGQPWLTQADGDRFVVTTQSAERGRDTNIVRLDPETGETMWSIKAGSYAVGDFIDGRLFVDDGIAESGEPESIIEYDIETGTEINRLSGDRIVGRSGGFAVIDAGSSTVQYFDLDFQPADEPVRIEKAETDFYPWVVSRTKDGWLNYSEHQITALDEAGTTIFECQVSIDDTHGVFMSAEDEVIASSYESIEFFEIDGDRCSSRWALGDTERLREYREYVAVFDYPGEGDDVDVFGHDAVIDVLDRETGESLATAEDDVAFDSKGRMMTFDGEYLVVREIESGDELWRIEATDRSTFFAIGEMVVLINPDGDRASIEIYSDPRWIWQKLTDDD